ncbi:MAG: head GIN domain-containing protein [Bacteroidota bacterium]
MSNILFNLISNQKSVKMRNSIIILLTALSMVVFTSCEKVVGEGPVVIETRVVTGFKSVAVSISGKVNYKIDPVYKVEIQAQQNILDILQTNKTGDELVIKFQDGKRVKNHEDIIVTISAPFAEGVNLSGSAEFDLINNLAADNLNLRVSGSGSINVFQATLTDKLTATISGSGNISVLNGAIKNESLKISGSGNIEAGNVLAEKAVTEISGSGHMKVNLSQNLDASISGSGSVYYRGNPIISTHISGSGKVTPF